MLRDRLGWLLSGVLIGILFMASCDMVDTAQPTRTSVVEAAPDLQPTNVQLPPDAPSNAPPLVPSGQGEDFSDTVSAVFNKGNPSVVRIDVTEGQAQSLGTGFVIDREGHIVTNYHVIASSSGRVIVTFTDGEAAYGDVIAFDEDADIAIVRVSNPDPNILFPAELGDSSQLRVGDLAVAIGNPFGENRTATAGIISAVRSSRSEGGNSYFSIPGVLQTDASINPGNSGGPLFNSRGQVIGVNTFILDPSGRGANIGIGFAVPINLVKRMLPDLLAGREYTHPFLGVELREISSLAAEQQGLPSKGVYVAQVFQGPAADAGVQQGDLIIAVDGQQVLSPGDIISYIEFNKRPGDQMVVTLRESNGGTRDLRVTVGARP